MSFLQLNLHANAQTKARPLILAGLIALGLSWELRPLPAADESLRETAAALTQTGLPDVIGAPMQHDSIIYSAQFSPDGQRILITSKDGTANRLVLRLP